MPDESTVCSPRLCGAQVIHGRPNAGLHGKGFLPGVRAWPWHLVRHARCPPRARATNKSAMATAILGCAAP